MRWTRIVGIIGAVVLALGLGFGTYIHCSIRDSVPIVVGPETTILTGPLRADGTVDYAAAINEAMSKGVMPENNLLVGLLPAIGTGEKVFGKAHCEIVRMIGGEEAVGCWQRQGHETIRDWHDIYEPWKKKDRPKLDAWLNSNEQALECVTKAVRERDRYWYPVVPTKAEGSLASVDIDPEYVSKGREITEAYLCRAMRSLGEGDAAGTWRDLLTMHRYGRLMSQDSQLVMAMAGIAWDQNAWLADRALLNSGLITEDLLRRMLSDMRSLPAFPRLSEVLHRREIYTVPDAVQTMARDRARVLSLQPVKLNTAPDWNAALRAAVAFQRERFAEHAWKSPEEMKKWCDESDRELDSYMKVAWKSVLSNHAEDLEPRVLESCGSYTRRVAAGLIAETTPRLLDRDEAGPDLMLVACAVELYRGEHGHYPKSLGELVPTYLDKVPVNRFGQAFPYEHTGTGFELKSMGNSFRVEHTGK